MTKFYEKWKKRGLLENTKIDNNKLSILLENQFNSRIGTPEFNVSRFKRISLDLVVKIFNNLGILDLINFSPMTNVASKISYKEKGISNKINFREIFAKTRMYKTLWTESFKKESEFVEFISSEISQEIQAEILKDLNNICKIDMFCDYWDENFDGKLLNSIIKSNLEIKKDTHGGSATWILIPDSFYKLISKSDGFISNNSYIKNNKFVCKVGRFHKWDVYTNPVSSTILIGSNTSRGYYFNPFIPLIIVGKVDGWEDLIIGTRYSKVLINTSERFCSRIFINGYSFKEGK